MRRSADKLILLTAVAVVATSVVLVPSEAGVRLGEMEFPPLCIFKLLTGSDCLGCGLTRSFAFMGDGQLGAALDMHLAGPVLFALVAAQLPWRTWRLLRR